MLCRSLSLGVANTDLTVLCTAAGSGNKCLDGLVASRTRRRLGTCSGGTRPSTAWELTLDRSSAMRCSISACTSSVRRVFTSASITDSARLRSSSTCLGKAGVRTSCRSDRGSLGLDRWQGAGLDHKRTSRPSGKQSSLRLQQARRSESARHTSWVHATGATSPMFKAGHGVSTHLAHAR